MCVGCVGKSPNKEATKKKIKELDRTNDISSIEIRAGKRKSQKEKKNIGKEDERKRTKRYANTLFFFVLFFDDQSKLRKTGLEIDLLCFQIC